MTPGSASFPSFESWAGTMSGIPEHARITRGLLSNRPKVAERTTDSLAALRDFLVLRYAKHVNRNVHVGTFSKGGQAQNYAMVPTPRHIARVTSRDRAVQGEGRAHADALPHVILHTSRLGNSLAAD